MKTLAFLVLGITATMLAAGCDESLMYGDPTLLMHQPSIPRRRTHHTPPTTHQPRVTFHQPRSAWMPPPRPLQRPAHWFPPFTSNHRTNARPHKPYVPVRNHFHPPRPLQRPSHWFQPFPNKPIKKHRHSH
jgi:hypothetical protein